MSNTEEIEQGEVASAVAVFEPSSGRKLSRWEQLTQWGRGQRGMTTAEYAVGTVAAVTFVGVLIKVLQDPSVQRLLLDLITWVLEQFWGN